MTSLGALLDSREGKRRLTRRVFATIADRYDLITVLLSYGRDRHWKNHLVQRAEIRDSERVLDLACGTGDLTLAAATRGARVVGLDITPRMIQLARRKPDAAGVPFLVGDMTALPFGDASFDVVTTGYGLRNVPALDSALGEIYRVLRPGGRFLSLDFDRPRNPLVRFAYLAYLTVVGSALGWVLHGDPDMYRYIPETIRRYPGSAAVVELMRRVGFAEARHTPVLLGLMAIHVARRDEA
ncbi:MAG: ubiquinone/menaquinone biosynthesis methyltransferase [Acidobacteria bacterium]|nr:ubiquinone/menaquinone biosynthesis methyltransferase [Acidobacteriota bacterium]